MPHPQATLLHVSPTQHDFLQHLVRRTTSPQRLTTRARIILAAGAGISNGSSAASMMREKMKLLLREDFAAPSRRRDFSNKNQSLTTL